MPVLDGFETTKRIRSREFRLGRARTPIVALTAHALREDRKRCLGSDMDDYLSKPYSPDELLDMVEHWVGPPPVAVESGVVLVEAANSEAEDGYVAATDDTQMDGLETTAIDSAEAIAIVAEAREAMDGESSSESVATHR